MRVCVCLCVCELGCCGWVGVLCVRAPVCKLGCCGWVYVCVSVCVYVCMCVWVLLCVCVLVCVCVWCVSDIKRVLVSARPAPTASASEIARRCVHSRDYSSRYRIITPLST